jgi:hypothetical protein
MRRWIDVTGGGRATLRRMTALSVTALMGTALMCAATGCEDTPAATSGPSSSSRYAPSAATTTGAPSAQASSTDAAPTSPYAGTYEGTFESKRGDVTVPEGVTYKSWDQDPGGFEGKNTIEIVVGDDGAVQGTIDGALGKLGVTGMAEDGALSAGLAPTERSDDNPMSGLLTGHTEGEAGGKAAQKWSATLRVSNANATIVRHAQLTLTRK